MSSDDEDMMDLVSDEEVSPVKPKKKPAAASKKPAAAARESVVDELSATGVGRSDSARKALEKKFEKLTPREHVLKRPDTYVGSTESVTQPMWVLSPAGTMEERTITFVPALYKIFDEILVNAADNKARDATMKEIRVDFDQASGRITCRNDGKGIPVEKHAEHGMYIPEMIFGHLLTGENFNDEEERVVGGRNGYGAKLANIFSTEFQITTNDKTSEQNYVQVWRDNMSVCGKPKITKAKAKDYTEVSFVPDYARFGMQGLDDDMMALFKKRVYDISGVTDKSVKVYLNGDLIPCNTFEKFVKMFTELPAEEEGGEEAGAGAPGSATKKKPSAPFVFAELNPRWQIALACSKDGSPQQVSFVNSICTYKGGQHVAYLQDKVAKYVMEYIEKKHKSQASVVKPQQIKNHLWLFVNALIVNPSFDSQTKENLTTKPAKFGPKEFLPEIPDDVLAKFVKNTNLIDSVLYWANAKQMKDLKKVGGGKKKLSLMDIPKLDDANNAGGKKSEECTLILTEGDSAKTLALSGISVVGRDNFGVFPLKGKLLNVREASHAQIMKNMEIQNLMRILGLKIGEKYENCKSLRYGRVLIMTDQDQDGSHIKGLVFNFFHFYFPSLLKIPGFLQVFVTPLVKISKERAPKETLAFYSSREYEAWRNKVCGEARDRALARANNLSEDALRAAELTSLKAWRVKYYKGLGTNSSKEAQEYFAKITTHTIEMRFDANSSDALDMAFSKARVEDRKRWLNSHDPETFSQVDFRAKSLDYKHFVDGELVLFSLADNVRSIPSAIDGFKPSQRKVLFACLKRNLVNEIKVSQLSGYVSEHGAYHHGEESLSGAIVNMAQSFVGSNNIPLLHAGGAFGTRRMGGKDSASGRYIFTKLLKITRAIFPLHDDPLLKRVEDDGMVVEPVNYVPIIPMLLVNGTSGIGTGWSTEIPSYNPKEIIQILFNRLDGNVEEELKLKPYFKGFSGQVLEEIKAKKGPTGRYLIRGCFELLGDKLFITELPVGKWTATYKDFLLEQANQDAGAGAAAEDKKAAKGKKTAAAAAAAEKAEPAFGKKSLPPGSILEIRENHTDETVDFELTLSPEFANSLREGGAEHILNTFQLQTTISTSNMTAFNAQGHIQRFETPEEIIDAFFAVRLPLYAERKRYLERELAREGEKLSSQARFVRMIVEGELVLSKKKRTQVLDELQALKFPKWFKTKTPGDEAKESGGGEEGEEDESKQVGAAVTVGGYEYLLSMTFWNLTVEKLNALEAKAKEKMDELEALRKKTAEDLWRDDLFALQKVMEEMEKEETELRLEQNLVRGKSQKGGAKSRKKYASSSGEEEDDDDDEVFGGKKKKKPAAKKQQQQARLSLPSPAAKRGGGITEKDIKPQIVVTAEEIATAKLAEEARKAKAKAAAEAPPKVKKEPGTTAAANKRTKKQQAGDEDDEEEESGEEESEEEEVVVVPRARPTARAAAQKKIVIDVDSDDDSDEDEDVDEFEAPSPVKRKTPAKKQPAAAAVSKKPIVVSDSEEDEPVAAKPKRAAPVKKPAEAPTAAAAKPKRAAPARKKVVESDEEEDLPPKPATKRRKAAVVSDSEEDFSPSPKKQPAAKRATATAASKAKPAAKKELSLAERLGVTAIIDNSAATSSALQKLE